MDFVSIAKDLGVPVAFLAVVIAFVWVVLKWAARQWEWSKEKIILPIALSHKGMMEAATSSSISQARSLEKLTEFTGTIVGSIEHQTETLDSLAAKIDGWPSDADKLCQLKRLMADAGVDAETVKRLLRREARSD